MAERPWMPIYWGDYVRDTMHLTTWQHGCYLLLICAYWVRGGPLPNDPEYLAGVCRTTQDKLARYGKPVLAMFTCTDGLLVHKRVEKELLKVCDRSAKARASAQLRARTTTTIVTEDKETPLAEGQRKASPNGSAGRPKPADRGSRLSEDWEPGEKGVEYAKALGLSADTINSIYHAFMRFWLAKAGKDARKVSWDLTWQTWVRREHDRLREQAHREQLWRERRGTAH